MLSKRAAHGLALAAFFAGAAVAGAAAAETGVHADRIVFGQSAALEGPASALGLGMQLGVRAAFAEANAAGGVGGKTLELVSYDDGYEPERAIEQTKKLIEQDQVFALIGGVGTPTSKAAQPIATEMSVPFVAPFTGASFLRDPSLGNVVNVRASYGQETEAWIRHLHDGLGYDRIAILYQDDSFGRVGLAGVEQAMTKRGLKLVAEGTYTRNTTAVKGALLEIRKAKPQAVVMVGAYKPVAEFIKLARKVKLDAVFVNISFVGSKALAAELGPDGAGVIVSQVVPLPWDSSIPMIQAYAAALKSVDANAEPGFVSLEGYIAGRLAVEAMRQAKGELTREAFLAAIKDVGSFDLGGITLDFGADDNQGMDQVFLTEIQADGSFKPVGGSGS